jgi:thiosulfate dehydrogenase (quinone) large subunit
MKVKIIKLFLRISIAAGFLSAVADRFGFWSKEVSAWGNWNNFLNYTQTLNPVVPSSIIPFIAWASTFLEIVFGVCLIGGFKTSLSARLSGWLLLIFAIAMTFSRGIKAPLDYSVFTASAAAFALSLIKEKFLELDSLIEANKLPKTNGFYN